MWLKWASENLFSILSALLRSLYGLQLPAVLLRRPDWAALATDDLYGLGRGFLRALGKFRWWWTTAKFAPFGRSPLGMPFLVHIFNHRSPCDGLVIQRVLRMPGLTTAQSASALGAAGLCRGCA